jgi:hypothetical protein
MIRDDIINELQYIPEFKLTEIYEIIHSMRLKFSNVAQPKTNTPNLAGCLKEYATSYIPTEQVKQQAWESTINEKYHRS